VIAGGQDVDPTIVELAAKAFGQAETSRRVLGVYHHQVDVELPPQAGYMLSDGVTAGSPYDVTAKQNFHRLPLPITMVAIADVRRYSSIEAD
jgi:hypothetical protein